GCDREFFDNDRAAGGSNRSEEGRRQVSIFRSQSRFIAAARCAVSFRDACGASRNQTLLAAYMTKLTQVWQRWRDWLRHHLHREMVQVLPPMQRSRAKPNPKPPHYRRAKIVHEALATAPSGSSDRELIAHVRAVTGIGCSFRTVHQWKKEQSQSASL